MGGRLKKEVKEKINEQKEEWKIKKEQNRKKGSEGEENEEREANRKKCSVKREREGKKDNQEKMEYRKINRSKERERERQEEKEREIGNRRMKRLRRNKFYLKYCPNKEILNS